MSYSALRKGRVSISGHAYLVTTVTSGRASIFCDLRIGRIVVRALRAEDDAERTRTLAFVVMPDHIHWLFQLSSDVQLTNIVKNMKGRSAHEINRLRGANGAVWQPSFHDHAVRAEEDLRTMARYVVGNPIRAGLVDDIRDYPLWDAIWL